MILYILILFSVLLEISACYFMYLYKRYKRRSVPTVAKIESNTESDSEENLIFGQMEVGENYSDGRNSPVNFIDESDHTLQGTDNGYINYHSISAIEVNLQEEFRSLQNILTISESKIAEMEISLKQFSDLLKDKEIENVTLKSNLSHLASMMNYLQHNLDIEKDKSKQLRIDKETALTNLELRNNQIHNYNEGHMTMYKMYVNKIEQLKGDISTCAIEILITDKGLKDNKEEIEEIRTKYKTTEEALLEKVEELIVKDCEIKKSQEMVLQLRNRCEELQKTVTNKDKDFANKHRTVYENNTQLKSIIHQMGDNIESKVAEIQNLKNKEAVFVNKVAYFNRVNGELKKNLDDKENMCCLLREEMVQKNARLELVIHNFEEEIKKKKYEFNQLGLHLKEFKIEQEKTIDAKNYEIENLKNDKETLIELLNFVRRNDDVDFNEESLTDEYYNNNTFMPLSESRGNKTSSIGDAGFLNKDKESGLLSEGIIQSSSIVNLANIDEIKVEIDNLSNEVFHSASLLEKDDAKGEKLLKHTLQSAKKQSEQISEFIIDNKMLEDGIVEDGINESSFSDSHDQDRPHCSACQCTHTDGTDKYKIHIDILEKELLKMQGRYYSLKETYVHRHNDN